MAAKIAKFDYFLYSHDDFYFAPNWDDILDQEVKKISLQKNKNKIKAPANKVPEVKTNGVSPLLSFLTSGV